MAEVHVQDGENLESALRRFKRKVQTEDIIKEIKRHSFYLKPGEKKRTKEALKSGPGIPNSPFLTSNKSGQARYPDLPFIF